MRIAQLVSLQESVPPKGKNGLEHMVYYLTEELVRRGHEVTLFATGDSRTSARLIEVLPYPMSKGVLLGLTSTQYSLMVMAKATEMSEEFDVIHSHLGPVAYHFSRLIKTPIVETVHSDRGIDFHCKKDLPLRKYFRDQAARFDTVHHVYVSRSQKKNFLSPKNSSVVHNGINFKDFTFCQQPDDYFAYLGYITENKGVRIAVQAARHAGVRLKLAGSYYGCEEYFNKEIKPYLNKQIEYVGVLEPKKRNGFLGGARALLFPIQWEEPFGLVMIEAMACGTPVIGFGRAAVPEVIKDGKTGYIVDGRREMEAAMGKIDFIRREDCRKHTEKYFSVSRMADDYERVYAQAIANFRSVHS